MGSSCVAIAAPPSCCGARGPRGPDRGCCGSGSCHSNVPGDVLISATARLMEGGRGWEQLHDQVGITTRTGTGTGTGTGYGLQQGCRL